MPLILGTNSIKDTGFEVANSCRFNIADSAYLTTKTNGSEPTLGTKYTVSVWLKRSTLVNSSYQYIISHDGGSNPRTHIRFNDDADNLTWYIRDSGGTTSNLTATRLFRDTNAWYHLVFAYDSTQASASNRQKIYVNGTQNTSFSSSGYVAQDVVNPFSANGNASKIASFGGTASDYYGGYMSEFVFVDGQALTPTSFGEFDEDSPTIWKPINVSGLTFGNNGYYLDFEASDNLGNDANGGTDFTENNLAATDQTTDTPTNNFCTMNPLDNYYGAGTFSEGNLKIVTLSSDYTYYTGTIGLTAGLWYFEAKLTATADDNQVHVGIAGRVTTNAQHELGHYNDTYAYYSADGDSRTNDGDTSYGTGFDTGDVLGVYIDLNANKLYFAKNGTVQNSGTGISITDPASVTAGAYFPAVGDWANQSCTWEVNFGNPSWSLSSAVADKNGYGSFEYNPSSGTFDSASKDFLAICTKNLGSDGG